MDGMLGSAPARARWGTGLVGDDSMGVQLMGGAISMCGEIVHFSNTRFHPKATAAATVRVLPKPMVDSRGIGPLIR